MPEDTHYRLEPLREGAEFTLWRGAERDDPTPILVLTTASAHPPPPSLKRLEHEYALADELDAAWAARPLALTLHQGREALILSDPGGEPLDQVIERARGRPLDLTRFLDIAIGLAAALGQVHRRGLVHRDIKPANALVDETGRAWLTGFGLASRLPRERLAPAPAEAIAGTLTYMSPEQTGRMNRSVDARSDLYSLGVTLYEMLTGVLPFAAADALEWVHCHIARQPLAPADRVVVPGPLSAIVMRLLAKNAEERYQTAAGVEHDLNRCRAEWQRLGSVEAFPLGEHDTPDRLLIPEKLYGRSLEVTALLDAYQNVVATGAPTLVLVSGYSGIGKSSVVNELHKVLVQGFFASGKFAQYKRDIPYATVAQAFQGLVRQILSQSEAELREWRRAIGEALGSNGRLITDLIPDLELLIGEQQPVADLPAQDAQLRFQAVLRRFIGVFARPQQPLALFLDDLQWVDPATLDLLEDLLTQGDIRYLLLIGAYRDNEVDAAHLLPRTVEAIRRAGAAVCDIVLAPLTDRDLGQMIADALHCELGHASALTRLVQQKTDGNPFFTRQFLRTLEEEALLVFDHAEARWSWDLRRIRAKGYSDNVVDLMVAKLNRLTADTSATVCQLACVGSGAAFAFLATVCKTSLEALHESLWQAVRAGLVLRSEDAYAFRHDRIQEAAYSLIPEDARAETHLRIGRLFLAHTPTENRDGIVFEIVGQFNRSAELVTSINEREQVAELNLIAGKRAKSAAAYASALTYFAEGRALLAKDCWTRQPSLTFELELRYAEAEFLTGDLSSAEARLSALAARATNLVDQVAVVCLRVDVYTTLARLDRAIDVGIEYLRQVGVNVSSHPTDETVRFEYERIWLRLGPRPIEELIDLPLMSDPVARAALDVLPKLMPAALGTDRKLHRCLVAYMVNLSLEFGNRDASCYGYVWLGTVLASSFGNHEAAFRFGQLSLDLVDKRGLDAFKARVYLIFGVAVSPWSQHVRLARAILREARDEARKIGDIPSIGHCSFHLVENSISSGARLSEVDRAATDGLEAARTSASDIIVAMNLSELCLVRPLRGLPLDVRSFDDQVFNENDFERHLEADPNLSIARCTYLIRRLQAFIFENNYASALQSAIKVQGLVRLAPSFFYQVDYHFYAALARAGSIDTDGAAPSDQQRQHLEAMKAHLEQVQTWAAHCPENFENRAALVGAEIARLQGRDLDAERLYEHAIRSARANHFVHQEALAYETAARFYTARGFEEFAEAYLVKARDGYRRWGADGKVRQLEARHPHFARAALYAPPSPDHQLDVATVVKASQVLSGEMQLPRLIERLMTIALQNAGAQRGLLILLRDGEPLIEAEATAGPGKVEVADRHAAIRPSDLPGSVLHYAIRTQRRVLLDDASTDDLYANDEYVRLKRSRSVLCLPLVKQAELVGVLYLENSLAPGAFTPDRVTVLELLASQAAISLENANLYTDLQLQVGVLQHLPVSAWTLTPDGTPDFVNQVWLEFAGQTSDFVQSLPDAWMTAVHPEDREMATRIFWDGVRSGQDFAFETRSLRARDGTYRWHLQQAVVMRDADGNVLKFVGTTTDIDDQKRTEQTLLQAQSDLAHVARVATLNAMTASIAHEVSQPLSGILTNASTGLRLLAADPPDVAGAAETARRTIRDVDRATAVIRRLRAMFSAKAAATEPVDLNEAAREVIALSAGELRAGRVLVQGDFAEGLPPVSADRVQLQQVILNLLLNAADAMAEVEDRPRTLLVRTMPDDDGGVRLAVRDAGVGVGPGAAEKLFQSFYTTKADGMGVGLSICRSIIESHEGRLWWEANDGPGATFSFWIPGMR